MFSLEFGLSNQRYRSSFKIDILGLFKFKIYSCIEAITHPIASCLTNRKNSVSKNVNGGVDSNRLRGDSKSRPLEPDPDHTGEGKLILYKLFLYSPFSGIGSYRKKFMAKRSNLTINSNNYSTSAKRPSAPDVFLKNVSFAYSDEKIFHSLNFTVKSGQWTCLIGPSGCGKSTLLRLISGNLREGLSGEICFTNSDNYQYRPAWMAQKDLLLPWLTVLDNVCLGARLRGEISAQKLEKAISLIEDAGLGAYSTSLPSELSGGMRQRVALLRTLMEERSVILMDEPFSALDALTRLKLQDLAAEMVKGATVLMVTHDPLEALRLGHSIYVMNGRPAQVGKAIIPPGSPPRKPGDSAIVSLQGELLDRLEGADKI